MKRLAGLVLLCGGVWGCFVFDVAALAPRGTPTTVDGEPVRSECRGELLDVGFVLDAGAFPAAPEGTSEVPLSPRGCFSWRRVVQNGQLVETAFVHVTGQFRTWSDGGVLWGRNVVTVPMRLARRADGLSAWFDLDEDGAIDETLEELYAGDALVSSARAWFDPSGTMIRQAEVRRVDAGVVHYRLEELQDGLVEVRADFDAPAVQAQLASCYVNSENTTRADENPFDCTREQLDEIHLRLNESLKAFHDCMSNFNGPVGDLVRLLDLRLSGEYLRMRVRCFSSKRVLAAVNIEERHPVLYVNRDMLRPPAGATGTCESTAFIRSTLGHEMLHLSRRYAHNPALEQLYLRGEISMQQLEMSDQVYACEALCTSSQTLNRCSCARCLKAKTCDERCSALDSCVVRQRQPDGGLEAITSEAVGALCGSQWFRSMAACRSSCSPATDCRSLRLGCDEACQ